MAGNVKTPHPVMGGVANVPVIMQLEALECGAASLAMVLAYYKKWIPLEQLRVDCGVSRDGSNARNILKAARSYGLNASGYRFEPEILKEKGIFPCIVHWNFNHFVVLDGFKRGKAYLNDPAKGAYSISMEEFDKAFTGVCLVFEPSESFVSDGKQKSVISFAKSRLKGAGLAMIFVLLTTLISSLIGVIRPGFSRVFVDRILTGKNLEWIYPFLIGIFILTILEIVIKFITVGIDKRINGRLASYGNASYMWKVLRLPMQFFNQRMAGDIQNRQESNATIASSLVNTFAPLVLSAAMMIFYLLVMLRYNPILTAIGLGAILINTIMSSIISKKRLNVIRVSMRDAGKLAGATVAAIEMIETIKASGAENGFFEKWSGYQASVNTQKVKFSKINIYYGLIPSIVSALCSLIILGMGLYLTIQGEFTVGMIIAFQGYMTSFSDPANKLISAGQSLQQMRADMERVEDVMQYPCDVNYSFSNNNSDVEYRKLSGNIELKNITFGYSRLSEPLIENFSLSIKQGEKIALVGGTGCGKSTLSKLISGLYQPWSGEVLFDGKSIKDIERSVFTGSLAVVDQDITIFEDTIQNNIKMWDDTIEDFEVKLAARDAQIHSTIMQRDGAYYNKLLEGGKNLSGGQRQRIEIARVLAQDPTIVVLDEATSALDAKTEQKVIKAICDRGITCIMIAHRLSTIRDCDKIIVLDHGTVVESGTHDELFAKGGKYTELVSNE